MEWLKRGAWVISALDRKALMGMLKREDVTSDYAPNVYDMSVVKTMAQV